MHDSSSTYDVVIVGSGVTGTALLYLLAKYSTVGRILLLEQYDQLASVSSHATQNSQTLHFGDIETNYSLEKARAVKQAADMIVRYTEGLDDASSILSRQQKMVLAVGEAEVALLRARHEEMRSLFPSLRVFERKELTVREPTVVEGRSASEPIMALGTDDGYTINFGSLAMSFVAQAETQGSRVEIRRSTQVQGIQKTETGFQTTTSHGIISSRSVVVSAGAHSLSLAHSLGFGRDLSIIPVAGFFYEAANRLRGKVYTIQNPKLPFAAIHGDPDILDTTKMRFGPIAKALPLLERGKWATVWDFLRVFPLTLDAFKSVWKINTDPVVRSFIFKNFWYDLPFIGPQLFIEAVQKIIPNMKKTDIAFGHKLGGIRPQVVNLREHRIQLGEAKIVEQGIIFNITPSPGASVCLATAHSDAKKLIEWLGPSVHLDESAIERDLLT